MVNERVSLLDTDRLAQAKALLANIEDTKAFALEFNEEYKEFQQSLYYSRTVIDNFDEEACLIEAYKKYGVTSK